MEIGLTSQVPLRIQSPEAVIASLLASVSPLKKGEQITLQWIVSRAEPMNTETNKEKLSDSLFLVVGRIGARGDDALTAKRLNARVLSTLASVSAYGVSWKSRTIPQGVLKSRMFNRLSPLVLTSLMNARELATLSGIQAGSPSVAGLPQGRARHIAPDSRIPSEGFVVGTANFPGAERPLAIPLEARTMHIQLTGQTGVGKTTIIENLMAQEMNDYGVIVLDPNGDLFDSGKNLIPQHRIDKGDVILFDPTDEYYPIGLNILEGDNPFLTADRVFAVFDGLYDMRGRMSRSVDVLQNALLALTMGGLTLVDMPLLLDSSEAGKDFRYRVTSKIQHAPVKHFWQNFEAIKDSERRQWVDPLMHRLNPFLIRPGIRASLGQVNSTFSIKSVVREGKILLVNLSKGLLGEDTSQLFASLILSQIWQASQGRADIAPERRKPVFAHLDEWHNYSNIGVSMETVLAEARKYGLCLTLAHQSMSQLPPSMRSATDQARTKILLQTAAADASAFARDLAPYVETSDLTNLQKYEAVLRVQGGAPATIQTLAPPRSLKTGRSALEASRRLYGRPLKEVEAEIQARQKTAVTPKEAPTIGWVKS